MLSGYVTKVKDSQMELKTSHNSARENITSLITEGNALLEKIINEYRELRRNAAFNQDKHIPHWANEYDDWFNECLSAFDGIFPTSRETVKLKNAPVSPVVESGTNSRWASLTNIIRAKLTALDQIIETLNNYSSMDESEKVSILFLAADPSEAARLRLGEEFREIQEKLRLAKDRDRFMLELPRLSVRSEDVSQALLDIRPRIVHFSGHGTPDGAICFENRVGQTQPIQPDALAALFKQFADQVNCVLLNACYSEPQAKAIARHIKYVIGMNQAISDKAAIAFAIGFYQALGARCTIEAAYELGRVQIGLQGVPEHLTPVLIRE
jgi:hypothetical protein